MLVGGPMMLFPAAWGDDAPEPSAADQAAWEAWMETCSCDRDAPGFDARANCAPDCPVHGDPELGADR